MYCKGKPLLCPFCTCKDSLVPFWTIFRGQNAPPVVHLPWPRNVRRTKCNLMQQCRDAIMSGGGGRTDCTEYTMFLAIYDSLLQCAWEKVCSTRRRCHVLYRGCAAYNYLPEARGLCSVHTIVPRKPLSCVWMGLQFLQRIIFYLRSLSAMAARSAAYIFLIGGLKMCNIYLFLSQFYTWGWGYWMWIIMRKS